MVIKLLVVMILAMVVIAGIGCYMFYLKGYVTGFNKCKSIDDEILDKYHK